MADYMFKLNTEGKSTTVTIVSQSVKTEIRLKRIASIYAYHY